MCNDLVRMGDSIDDFDPDNHEPYDVHEYEVAITVEEYRLNDDGVFFNRFLKMETNKSDHHSVDIDAENIRGDVGWLVGTDFKLWLEGQLNE